MGGGSSGLLGSMGQRSCGTFGVLVAIVIAASCHPPRSAAGDPTTLFPKYPATVQSVLSRFPF